MRSLKRINTLKTAILLVEQNAYAALEFSHRGYILEVGTITLKGGSQELKEKEEAKKKYLGG